jgi:hypothetical protein
MSLKENDEIVEATDLERIVTVEVVDLEPITIGKITEVTTGGVMTANDEDTVVWGT